MTLFSFSFSDYFFVGIQALKTKSEKATEESPKRKRKGTIKINLFHKQVEYDHLGERSPE